MGNSQKQHHPTSLCPEAGSPISSRELVCTPNQRRFHLVEVKYCKDTRPRSQLEAAHHQHSGLRQYLCRDAANISLHTILMGVGATINNPCRFFIWFNMLISLLVPDVLLRKFCNKSSLRPGVGYCY